MKQNKDTIKSYFETGDKPTQDEYYDTWDSFWHKDDNIPSDSVSDLGLLSPINYTKTSEKLTGHLEGIDEALASTGQSTGAAGNDQEVQFNSSGALASSSSLKFNPTEDKLYATQSEFSGGTSASVINTDRSLTYVKNPQGGQYSLSTANRTGFLVIKAPHTVGNNYVHYNFTLEIGSQTESPLQMHVSALWLTNGFSKLNAYSVSKETRNYTIRAGSDGTNIYFLIGEADTSWVRSYVKLKDISITYAYKDVDVFKSGWNIDFATSVANFVATKTQLNVDVFGQVVGVTTANQSLQQNSWNTIAVGSPQSCSATILLKRLDQIEGSLTVSNSYGSRTLKLNYLAQYSEDAIKGIRFTQANEVQVLMGDQYTSSIDITLVNSSGEFSLTNAVASGSEIVMRSIDLNGKEFGEIHSDAIEALDGVILKSADDTKWKISVDNTGTLVTTSI